MCQLKTDYKCKHYVYFESLEFAASTRIAFQCHNSKVENESYQLRFYHYKLIDIVNCVAISIHGLIEELILIVFE